SWERLEGAENSLARIAGTCRNLKWAADHAEGEPNAELADALTAAMAKAAADYEACMDDDFNTAGAVAAYFQLV
ncbi:MAG: DALR domain-containing protein, partial [Collinsella intestinalis]